MEKFWKQVLVFGPLTVAVALLLFAMDRGKRPPLKESLPSESYWDDQPVTNADPAAGPDRYVQPSLDWWSSAEVLEQRETGRNDSPSLKRETLLRIAGLDYPVLRVEDLKLDESSGEYVVIRTVESAADRILARFRRVLSDVELAGLAGILGAIEVRSLGVGQLYSVRLGEVNLDSTNEALARLRKYGSFSKLFQYVEIDYIVHAFATPNDPNYQNGDLWGMHNTGQESGEADIDIDAPEGWEVRTSTDEIIIAVIDSGVNYDHHDLAGNMWTNLEEIPNNGIDDDENGYVDDVFGIDAIIDSGDPFDDNGHGTHCAGTIGAVGDNGIGVAGVAWNTRIMALKFLSSDGAGAVSDAIKCINYAATMGADVLSNSWGGGGYSQALRDSIETAGELGISFVAAAGNAAENNDLYPAYPASYDLRNIVSVASIDRFGKLSGFSNFGSSSVDIAAPGSSILSTWIGGPDAYKTISGTSMATPHVSGILGLLMAEYSLDNLQANMNRLLYGETPIESLEGKMSSAGVANLNSALTLIEAPYPPLFLERPKNFYHDRFGGTLTIESEIESELPVTFRWYKGDSLIEGESSETLVLNNLDASSVGDYRIEASNDDGTVSARFSVSVLNESPFLANAVDNEFLSLYTFGNQPWNIHSTDSVVGESSIRSGSIGDNEYSSVYLDIQGPGSLTFDWRLSSEPYWDYGLVTIDGLHEALLSSQNDWDSFAIVLNEARIHRIEWSYVKDGSGSVGQDALFLDNFRFHPQSESPPIIVKQPQSAVLSPEASIDFAVVALGESLVYQWFHDGVLLEEESASTLSLTASDVSIEGSYYVKVQNEFGAVTSDIALLEIAETPVTILISPGDVVARTGERVTFSVSASGSLPIEYSWFLNGSFIEGEGGDTLTLSSIDSSDVGSYSVRASNPYTSVPAESTPAVLEILDVAVRPRIVKQPIGGHWQEGDSLRLSVDVVGEQPILYQWFKDGEILLGATDRFYSTTADGDDSGMYYVLAENSYGRSYSDTISVFVVAEISDALDLPEVDWDFSGPSYFFAQSENTFDGEDALQSAFVDTFRGQYFEMSAEVEGPANFSVFWKQIVSLFPSFVGLYVDDELQASMDQEVEWREVLGKIGSGIHTVRFSVLSEQGGTIFLDTAKIAKEPKIYRQPSSKVLLANSQLELSVDAYGAGEIAYQWFKDDVAVEDATLSSFIVENAVEASAGNYHVSVESEFGQILSDAVSVEFLNDVEASLGAGAVVLNLSEDSAWEPWRASSERLVLRSGETQHGEVSDLVGMLDGPGVLVYELALQSYECCPLISVFLDEELVETFSLRTDSEQPVDFRKRFLKIPAGPHQVRWSLRSSEGATLGSEYGFLKIIELTSGPVIERQPRDLRLIEGDDARLLVEMYEDGEYLYQWFRGDKLIAGARSAELVVTGLSEEDAGEYICVVTDGVGVSTISRSATVDVVVGFYDAAEVVFSDFYLGTGAWTPQSEISWDGEDALSYDAASAGSLNTLAMNTRLPAGERRALRFSIRIEGLGAGGFVSVIENGRKTRRWNSDTDWVEVTLPLAWRGPFVNQIAWQVNKGHSGTANQLGVWIDRVEFIEEPTFYTRPFSVSLRYGQPFELSAEVTGTHLDYRWSLNGTDLGIAVDEVKGGKASFSTVGTYEMVSNNKVAQSAVDRSSVSFVDRELGAAVGQPNLLSTQGEVLWQVTDKNTFRGSKATVVEGVDSGEKSELIFQVYGPGELSFHWKLDSPSEGEKLYCYIQGTLVNGLYQSSNWREFTYNLSEAGLYEVRVQMKNFNVSPAETGRAWVDAVRFSSTAHRNYQTWTETAFAADSSLADSETRPEADPDEDGNPNFVEYAFLLDPLVNDAVPSPIYRNQQDGMLVTSEFNTYREAGDRRVGLEISEDLLRWHSTDAELLAVEEEGDTSSLVLQLPQPDLIGPFFVRVVAYWPDQSE